MIAVRITARRALIAPREGQRYVVEDFLTQVVPLPCLFLFSQISSQKDHVDVRLLLVRLIVLRQTHREQFLAQLQGRKGSQRQW
jgi:hypothetical protein